MGSCILHISLPSIINLLLLCLSCISIISTTDSQVLPGPLKGLACSIVNCGEGTCRASKTTILGIECDCKPGWRHIPLASFAFPSCVLPNCTVDLHCGSRAPPPPSPSLPLLPTINASSPCNLVWCGNGDCIANGNSHYCKCNQGSTNYMGDSSFACFEPCYFGEDCKNLNLGPLPRLPPLHLPPVQLHMPPSLPTVQLPPPLPLPPPLSSTSSGSIQAGTQEPEADDSEESNGASSYKKNHRALIAAVLIALVSYT